MIRFVSSSELNLELTSQKRVLELGFRKTRLCAYVRTIIDKISLLNTCKTKVETNTYTMTMTHMLRLRKRHDKRLSVIP